MRYEVTVPTMQRAIARLEELGLLFVRHGSGMTVLDPVRHANPMILPYWIQALHAHPEQVRKPLEDFLALRRTLLAELLAAKPAEQTWAMLDEPLDELARCARQLKPSWRSLMDAELCLERQLLQATGQTAYAMIFNVFERLLQSVPELQRARYGQADAVLTCWEAMRAQPKQPLEALINHHRALDALTIERFIGRAPSPGVPSPGEDA